MEDHTEDADYFVSNEGGIQCFSWMITGKRRETPTNIRGPAAKTDPQQNQKGNV